MKEIGLLAVAHDEHEGLLTAGVSERAHGGCQVSRGSQARAWAAVGTARKPWARVGDPRGGLKATKALTLELCQLSSVSPTLGVCRRTAPSRVFTAEDRVLLHWGKSTHSPASFWQDTG